MFSTLPLDAGGMNYNVVSTSTRPPYLLDSSWAWQMGGSGRKWGQGLTMLHFPTKGYNSCPITLSFSHSYSYYYCFSTILVILLPLPHQAWRCQELPAVVSLCQLPLTFINGLFNKFFRLTTGILPRPFLIHQGTTVISYSPGYCCYWGSYPLFSLLFCSLCIRITQRSSVLQLFPTRGKTKLRDQLRMTTQVLPYE